MGRTITCLVVSDMLIITVAVSHRAFNRKATMPVNLEQKVIKSHVPVGEITGLTSIPVLENL